MEQVYTPNIHIPATRGWCLKYIDDAGNAPNRTATARYAFQVEQKAGRIRTGEIPENVWVVGFMDFTAGAYTTYGHVFFIKRNGKSYQIYDSEVQGGARKPYGSLNEILAWFGAYSPVYLGWSTHCDGRQYAKGGSMATINSREEAKQLYVAVLHRNIKNVSNQEADGLIGRELSSVLAQFTHNTNDGGKEWHYNNDILGRAYPEAQKEIKALKKHITELEKGGEFVKISDLYIKKGGEFIKVSDLYIKK